MKDYPNYLLLFPVISDSGLEMGAVMVTDKLFALFLHW